MGLKYIKDFKLFEELDAFSRVGDKGWVVLVGDERFEYFRRWLPEEVTSSEMLRLEGLFSKFNNRETSIDKEIPSDDGYKVNTGAFSVRLKIGYYAVPFNFYKRSDDWWLIWCKCRCNWVHVCNDVEWNRETKLNGGSIILCDSIEGIEEFLTDYDSGVNESDKFDVDESPKRERSYSERVSGRLFSLTWNHWKNRQLPKSDYKSEWWEYLGERNSAEWSKNISDLLNNQTYRPLDEKERLQISEWLKPVLSDEKSAKGWNPITKTYQDWVQYPTLTTVQNSRFEDCWFTKKSEDGEFKMGYGWDICIQGFSDEWYLVNVGDGRGYINHWFRIDTFEGLEKFIKSVFLEV